MPSTTFLEDKDKTLVQLAREYTGKGRGRIAWKNVAQKMKRWSRSPAELPHRLNSLKRTFGADLSKFPPSFYTPVRAARGRRNACIVQIRQGRRCSGPKNQQRSQQARLQLQPDQTRSTKKSTCPLAVTEQRQVPRLVEKQDARGTGCAQPVLSTTFSDDDVTETVTASSHSINNGAGDCCYRPERDLVSISQTSMSSKDVHHAVIALFEDISQQEVVYPPNAPHLDVGVLLPTGISAFIGAITAGDVFMDIGSGVGNVAAQFVLSTAVRASVGIEIRRDLVDRCNATLVENVMQWPNLQKVEVYAEDAKKVELSMVHPFSSATIVFANNLRFYPTTTIYITNELLLLTDAWIVAFTSEICPRHNSVCRNGFCSRWKLCSTVKALVS